MADTNLKSSPLTYQRVRQTIIDRIASGQLQPGDKLASERQLAKDFGCNFHTVRRGLALLEQERWIERRIGAGTFILRSAGQDVEPIEPPKAAAKGLLGVICPSRLDNFATEMLHHLHHEAERRGLGLSIRTVSDFGSTAQQIGRQMLDQGCLALLVPWMPDPAPAADLWQLARSVKGPLVLSRPYPGLEAYCYERPEVFGRAEFTAVEMCCRYFQELGHSRIAFFGPDTLRNEGLGHRVLAYSRFASHHAMANLASLVGGRADEVDAVADRWSAMAGDLAVICFDDDHALRLMTAAHKRGLRIPQDIAVLGFNNIPLSRTSDPPLSTVQFDYDYVATSMLDHAQALADGRSAQAEGLAREKLVIRDSCGGRLRAGENLDQILERIGAANGN